MAFDIEAWDDREELIGEMGFSVGVIAHWSDLAKTLELPILAGLYRAAMETGVEISGARLCDLRRECQHLVNAAADRLASPVPDGNVARLSEAIGCPVGVDGLATDVSAPRIIRTDNQTLLNRFKRLIDAAVEAGGAVTIS